MIMLAAALGGLPAGAANDRVVLASALALTVGALCLLARALRFDAIASFLSRPILTGFMTGISLSILVGQIGRFTGVKIEADGLLRPFIELLSKASLIHWPSVVLATAMTALLLAMPRLSKRIPGPVVVVVISVLLSWLFDFPAMGIKVVGDIPNTFPSLASPWPVPIGFNQLAVSALSVWLVSFSAGIVSARAFGIQGNYKVSANQELIGFAAANLASGLFSGFPVTSSDSRTAINLSVGGKTRLAGLASAAVLVIILLYLNPLLKLLPTPAMGAILAAAAIGLMDFGALGTLWRISRIEFVFALIGLFAPILLGVLQGVAIAIAATLAYLLYRGMHPRIVLLGRIEGQPGFYKLHLVPQAAPIPGVAIVLIQASVVFYNADYVKDEIEAIAATLPANTKWLIIDASSMPYLDSTAAATLIELHDGLAHRGIELGIAELHSESLALLTRAGVADVLGKPMIFVELEELVAAYRGRQSPTLEPAASGER
jgi:sulfate permease, SulP family